MNQPWVSDDDSLHNNSISILLSVPCHAWALSCSVYTCIPFCCSFTGSAKSLVYIHVFWSSLPPRCIYLIFRIFSLSFVVNDCVIGIQLFRLFPLCIYSIFCLTLFLAYCSFGLRHLVLSVSLVSNNNYVVIINVNKIYWYMYYLVLDISWNNCLSCLLAYEIKITIC